MEKDAADSDCDDDPFGLTDTGSQEVRSFSIEDQPTDRPVDEGSDIKDMHVCEPVEKSMINVIYCLMLKSSIISHLLIITKGKMLNLRTFMPHSARIY